MANSDTNQDSNEVVSQAPPPSAAQDAPPNVSTPAPSVDLSGLVQPGSSLVPGQAAPSAMGTQDFGGAMQRANTAAQNIQELNKPTPPPAPIAHERLYKIIQAIGIGLSNAATSIGTSGREGGAKGVLADFGEIQRQKLQGQEAAQSMKNVQIQQQVTALDTNYKLAQMISFGASLPDETAKRHLELAGEQQRQNIVGADFQEAHGGMNPSQFSSALSDTSPVRASGGTSGSFFTINAQQTLSAAKTAGLPDTDPFVQNLQKMISDPNATAKDLHFATQRLQNQQQLQSKAIEENSKRQLAAGAQIKTDQEQLAQNTYNRTVPKNAAGQPVEDFATWQARSTKEAEVAAQQGDPAILGAMAANGLVTMPQVALARQLDKKGLQKFFAAANEQAKANGAPEIVVNGRPTGQYFNQTAATQQYQYVTEFNNPNSKNQQSINAGLVGYQCEVSTREQHHVGEHRSQQD